MKKVPIGLLFFFFSFYAFYVSFEELCKPSLLTRRMQF